MANPYLPPLRDSAADAADPPWYRLLTRYHWFVLFVASLGWMFDCLDQQLFILARIPAMKELLAGTGRDLNEWGGIATSVFLAGWASGGLAFGVLGDRIGRARTMLLTILLYSLCTGLSAFSVTFWDFAFYRFLTGLGVGGEFAVGVALVAEVMPDRARPFALGLLQALSAVGNVSAALIGIGLFSVPWSGFELFHVHLTPWRLMFTVGILPALLTIVIRRRLKEPERWTRVAEQSDEPRSLGSYRELFGNPRWRRRAIGGMFLAASGVIGLWAIGFYSFDLNREIFQNYYRHQAYKLSDAEMAQKLMLWAGISSIMFNFGACWGIYMFSYLAHWLGRRPTFAICLVAAAISTASAFAFTSAATIQVGPFTLFRDVFWLVPIMGFCQLSLFGGYAVYFPELFPTHLRSTGTSFCYNVGRFVSCSGPLVLGQLTSVVFKDSAEPLRGAGLMMCSIFAVGLMVLPWLPETKGQPLPE